MLFRSPEQEAADCDDQPHAEELQHPEDTAHARIYDRLLEMCSPLCFTGENLRKAAAQGKMEQLKRLLAGKEICL